MKLFGRSVRLDLSGLKVTTGQENDLKVSFAIDKDLSGNANTAEITIWNLAEGNRNRVGKELDHVILEAGYEPPGGGSNVGVIFSGRIRDVAHRRVGPDIETTINCGDGDQALRRATINKTFPRGTPVTDVLDELQGRFEGVDEYIRRGEWVGTEGLGTLTRPETLCGQCFRAMNQFGRSKGFYWSFQNEKTEIFPGDQMLRGYRIEISPESGMIDSPTITDNGVSVRTLLNPQIAPGRLAVIRSQTLEMNAAEGEYRISAATFSGDNKDGEFGVTIEGERVQGGKVDEGKR